MRVLVLTLVFAQKDRTVLKDIADFLRANGISSIFSVGKTRVNFLKITKIKDIVVLLSKLKLVVKTRQAEASLRYPRGEVTGNELLSVFHEEYFAGRRRFSPLRRKKLDYFLRHSEAVSLAQEERVRAAMKARNCLTVGDLRRMVTMLPTSFEVEDVMNALGENKNRAYYLIRLMRRNGLVICKKLYRPHHARIMLSRHVEEV